MHHFLMMAVLIFVLSATVYDTFTIKMCTALILTFRIGQGQI